MNASARNGITLWRWNALALTGALVFALAGYAIGKPERGSRPRIPGSGGRKMTNIGGTGSGSALIPGKLIPNNLTLSADTVNNGGTLSITVRIAAPAASSGLVMVSVDPALQPILQPPPTLLNPGSTWPRKLLFTRGATSASMTVAVNGAIGPMQGQVFAYQDGANPAALNNRLGAALITIISPPPRPPGEVSTQPIPISLNLSAGIAKAAVQDFDATVSIQSLAPVSNFVLLDVSDRNAVKPITTSGVWPFRLGFSGRTNALLRVKTMATSANKAVTLYVYQDDPALLSNLANRRAVATVLITP